MRIQPKVHQRHLKQMPTVYRQGRNPTRTLLKAEPVMRRLAARHADERAPALDGWAGAGGRHEFGRDRSRDGGASCRIEAREPGRRVDNPRADIGSFPREKTRLSFDCRI